MIYIDQNNNIEVNKGKDLIFTNRDYLIRDFINLMNKIGTTKLHLFNLFLLSIDMAYYFGVMFGKYENIEKNKQRYRMNVMEMDALRLENKNLKAELKAKSICVNCDQKKETHNICSDCLNKIVKENKALHFD